MEIYDKIYFVSLTMPEGYSWELEPVVDDGKIRYRTKTAGAKTFDVILTCFGGIENYLLVGKSRYVLLELTSDKKILTVVSVDPIDLKEAELILKVGSIK